MRGFCQPGGVSIAAKSSSVMNIAAKSSASAGPPGLIILMKSSGSWTAPQQVRALDGRRCSRSGSGLSAQEAARPRCRGGFQPLGFIIRMKSPKFMDLLPHASKIMAEQSSTGLSGKSRWTLRASIRSSLSASKKRKAARSIEPRQ